VGGENGDKVCRGGLVLERRYQTNGRVAHLVTISRPNKYKDQLRDHIRLHSPPESEIRHSTQPSSGLDRLMGRTVLAESNGVMCGNGKNAKV